MIFDYQATVSASQDSGDYFLILRPEIPITVIGPDGESTQLALVDTGADESIFPESLARELGITLENTGGHATAFGGQRVLLQTGEVILKLESDDERLEWNAVVSFFETPPGQTPTLVLGHAGFLDYFSATFDGHHSTLTLAPNDDLPRIP